MFKSNLNYNQKKNLTITLEETIKDALIKINNNLQKCLIVIDKNNKLKGTLTDGNIRRGFLLGLSLDSEINKIYTKKNIIFIKDKDFCLADAKKTLIKNYYNTYIGVIPIIDANRKVIDFFTKDSVFITNKNYNKNKVIIMAGGKGSRLRPFTNSLPKPLIPIGNKTALERIVDNFKDNGFNHFYFSINYKSKLIKAYIQELKQQKNIKINFIEEKFPLGTAGSLKLLNKSIRNDFFVINCDSLIKVDFLNIINYHKLHNNFITVVVSMKNIEVPYGIFNIKKNGRFSKIIEKPNYKHLVNIGLYVINPKILKLIPKNKKFDFNELIYNAKKNKFKVGLFPIEDDKWIDVGKWSEIKKISMGVNELL